jgi:hypothetical protein
MRLTPLAASLAALCLLSACQAGPATANFAWQGGLDEGAWVRIRNMNGRIEVRRSPDARVTVGAEVRTGGRRVTFVRDSSATQATFCVVFRETRDTSCDRLGPGGRSGPLEWIMRRLYGRDAGQASVKYVLFVPEHVRLDLRTTNGAIDVQSVVREVRAQTINGKVTAVAVTGGMSVETVNGSIDAELDLSGDGAISLKTVNGSVTAEIPASTDAEVELSTVNGSASSDFALEGATRKRRHGTLGAGGRQVELKTVNGSVTLRRGA